LALDISTVAGVASDQFVSSHERLGRNRPENGLHEAHLNKDFFSKVVGSRGTLLDWKSKKVVNVTLCAVKIAWIICRLIQEIASSLN